MSEAATETQPEAAPEAPEAPDSEQKPAEADATEQLEEVPSEDAWKPDVAREKIRKLNQEIRATKQKLAEAPKADDVAAKDARISELEAANLRFDIAYDLGLPKEIAMRLQGSTREEMLADAEKLVELIAPSKRPTQKPVEALRGGLTPDVEPEETDLRKLGERMFRT